MSEPKAHEAAGDGLREEPFPPFRNILDDFLGMIAAKHNIHVLATFDLSVFTAYVARCKAEKRRPPSLVAYVARCVGVVLAENPRFMASVYKGKFLVPEHVSVVLTAMTKAGGDYMPLLVTIKNVDEKPLAALSREIAETMRGVRKRSKAGEEGYRRAMWFAQRPAWFRRGVYRFCGLFPKLNRGLAGHLSCVFITSITQYSEGRGGWGLPMSPYSLGITLGGMSKKALVVGDQIVARECLDITLTIDHVITDGAPATTLSARLGDEIESGRLLAEFDTEVSEANLVED